MGKKRVVELSDLLGDAKIYSKNDDFDDYLKNNYFSRKKWSYSSAIDEYMKLVPPIVVLASLLGLMMQYSG